MTETTIFVQLLDEGVDVWRPVLAETLGANKFRIVESALRPEHETWEFPPGAVVRCVIKNLDTGPELVAVETAE